MESLIALLLPMIVGHSEVGPGIYQIDLLTPEKTIITIIAKEDKEDEHSRVGAQDPSDHVCDL